ncbi:uncharacterized protein LOC120337963 [Styela clava]|uniref:uncharacterized protein LOC120337963 n=1 Tax=Styela clava TaxID=7725 RepID=UPI00193AC015|nr:uncharacterized protein LOC120337963 [Styela clava]
MQRQGKVVHRAEVEAEKRAIIRSDTQDLLVIQREGNFTFRCVDCLYNPTVCLKSFVTPCIAHGENAEEIGLGEKSRHTLLCLLSPLWYGSSHSVGKAKTIYRQNNTIPGLVSDDNCLGCIVPCLLIAQLRNELNERQREESWVKQAINEGQSISRD